MNIFQKQLKMNDGRTLFEHAKDSKGGPLDCSTLEMGEPAHSTRVSAEEFESTIREIKSLISLIDVKSK